MADEIISKIQIKKPRGKVHELLINHSIQEPNQPDTKRERFLALLKSRYGYSNDKAVDELGRLLTQFYRSNRSLGIRQKRPIDKNPDMDNESN